MKIWIKHAYKGVENYFNHIDYNNIKLFWYIINTGKPNLSVAHTNYINFNNNIENLEQFYYKYWKNKS